MGKLLRLVVYFIVSTLDFDFFGSLVILNVHFATFADCYNSSFHTLCHCGVTE